MQVGNSVAEIGVRAFLLCSSLNSFTGKFASKDNRCLIVDGVLKSFAPAGLTTYSIPDIVTSVGDMVFEECHSLTSVDIPNSVFSIGEGAFRECNLETVKLPLSVTSIGNYAFAAARLTSVDIPNSVTSIGVGAFSNCRNLTSITGKFTSDDHRCLIVNGVLVSFAFAGLMSYEVPNIVTSLGYGAMVSADLTSVVIPNSVTECARYAFLACSRLTDITSLAVTPPRIEYETFDCYTMAGATLRVPAESVEAYKTAEYWSEFENIVGIGKKRCAVPTIGIADGKLVVASETVGALCYTSITSEDFKGVDGVEPIELTGVYNISAYAHAEGYENSETAVATLVWVMPEGDATGLLNMEAKKAVVIQAQDGKIVVIGTEKLEKVHLYNICGQQLASVSADDGQTVIPCSVGKGEVVVVKYGGKAVKIVM